MRFHIEKVYLWFSHKEKTVLSFENNKVNVVRGNSSRGKSNIFAIIDYCLMSDRPNIVEPVINEYTSYYGLEFVLDGQYYSVSRKKPEDGIGADSVFLIEEPFPDDYYPSNANMQVSNARLLFDRKFGIKDDAYQYPFGKESGADSFVVSFRSFLLYNALTENIISSQYEYLNYKFFEDSYMDKDYKREYLFDMLLGVDNVEEKRQIELIDALKSNHNSTKRKNTKYQEKAQAFASVLSEAKQLAQEAGLTDVPLFVSLTGEEQIIALEELIDKNEPHTPEDAQGANERRSLLTQNLYRKQLQLNNILRARKEYEDYQARVTEIEDCLKPVEFLKQHIDELGVTAWSKHIVDSLQRSLEGFRTKGQETQKAFVSDAQIDRLRKDIKEIESEIQKEEKIVITPIQNSQQYYILGRLREYVGKLKELYAAIPRELPRQIDEVADNQLRKQAEEKVKAIRDRRATVVSAEFNPAIQHYFDQFKYLENFAGSKTRYNRDHERLEIGKDAILNYTNIGSQSNYMFLHICFFLGLHRFLQKNPSQYVGQFLFIDQPSIPYYESSDDTKSTDRLKLMDAFRVINNFMEETNNAGEEFQIILIEHADESYWTGEYALSHFVTKANFEGNEALVPLSVINQYNNETKE